MKGRDKSEDLEEKIILEWIRKYGVKEGMGFIWLVGSQE
jgi:hypothetical protein